MNQKSVLKIKTMTGLLLFGLVFIPVTSLFPADYQAGAELFINELVPQDLYVAGGEIRVKAPIRGDLSGAGGELSLNGSTGADVNLFVGQLDFTGEIADDLRCICGQGRLNGKIGGEAMLMGGDFSFAPDSRIGGDLVFWGGKLQTRGKIKGNLIVQGGDITINGDVGGNLVVQGGRVEINGQIKGLSQIQADTLVIGSGARFTGPVEYFSENGKVDFGTSTGDTAPEFNPELATKSGWSDNQTGPLFQGAGAWLFVYGLAAGLVFLVVFAFFFGAAFRQAGEKLLKSPPASLGIGFLYYATTPVAGIILMITVIGIPFAFFLGMIYLSTILLGTVLAAPVIAYALDKKLEKNWSQGRLIGLSLGIFILLKLLGLIPILGWLLIILVVLATVGALVMQSFERLG